ncbi:MAG: PEP/pyruvate-binding domain-containing protein [Acetobacteraceae bacterium]|nr:PEP/pyruvate-binding domain-containing protein [Acetobacteraceae bacterium]
MADLDPCFILAGTPLPPGGAAAMGNKAWNLMRMADAGLPVPPGFVLPTPWCRARRTEGADDAALYTALANGIARLEGATDLTFGSPRRPLLVSVRSGAAISMPGMLETVLNVGLNHRTVDGLIRLTGNPRLAWDSFRRLVQGFAEVVAGLDAAPFEAALREAVQSAQVETERELDHLALRALTGEMLALFDHLAGHPFPADPMAQLTQAAAAVFASWDAPKAVSYRRLNLLSDDAGTAVTVQTMVFGNAGGGSGAGVGFTRDPATGVRALYFDFCFNGQGEDVVAGRRTLTDSDRLRRLLPVVYDDLQATQARLEALFADVQDFEFTVQEGRLFLLQTRRAQRTPLAALRIAVDMVEERLITPAEAMVRLASVEMDAATRTRFAAPLPAKLAEGVIAGPGVAAGPIALDTAEAERLAEAGTPPILVRPETATSDIAGMARAAGILTAAGSRTSHAAVVARQLGKPCLVGCSGLTINLEQRTCRIGDRTLAEGDPISLDGNDGAIYPGMLGVLTERPERELAAIESWRHAAVL